MPTPFDKCKTLVKECEEFHRDPFAKYKPTSWYYRWWYIPKCGKPNYEELFKNATNKKYCMEVANGKKAYNAIRFRDDCMKPEQKLLKKHQIKEKLSWWDLFFSFWKDTTNDAEEQSIQLPLLQHKQTIKEQIDSGSGLFFLVGDAFLMHKHPEVVVYDPFFNHRQDFDIRWFGRLSNIPGSYYIFNMLYSNFCLTMEFEKQQNPLGWVVKKHNFDSFHFSINRKTNELTVRVNALYVTITRRYSLKDKTFICFPLLVTLPNGIGHTTSLVYHIPKKTWEHFEPNGYIWYWADHMDDYLEVRLKTLIRIEEGDEGEQFLPFENFYRVKEITPNPCFQQLDRKGTIKGVDVAMYCATWTFWYLHIRFSNPQHTPPYIVKKIIQNVEQKEKRETYIVFIRSYALIISRIIEELYGVFSSYYIKSWFTRYKTYQDSVREIFDYYMETYFSK